MKLLITKIESCFDCPFKHYQGAYNYFCTHSGNPDPNKGRHFQWTCRLRIPDPTTTPSWCPLPDKELGI